MSLNRAVSQSARRRETVLQQDRLVDDVSNWPSWAILDEYASERENIPHYHIRSSSLPESPSDEQRVYLNVFGGSGSKFTDYDTDSIITDSAGSSTPSGHSRNHSSPHLPSGLSNSPQRQPRRLVKDESRRHPSITEEPSDVEDARKRRRISTMAVKAISRLTSRLRSVSQPSRDSIPPPPVRPKNAIPILPLMPPTVIPPAREARPALAVDVLTRVPSTRKSTRKAPEPVPQGSEILSSSGTALPPQQLRQKSSTEWVPQIPALPQPSNTGNLRKDSGRVVKPPAPAVPAVPPLPPLSSPPVSGGSPRDTTKKRKTLVPPLPSSTSMPIPGNTSSERVTEDSAKKRKTLVPPLPSSTSMPVSGNTSSDRVTERAAMIPPVPPMPRLPSLTSLDPHSDIRGRTERGKNEPAPSIPALQSLSMARKASRESLVPSMARTASKESLGEGGPERVRKSSRSSMRSIKAASPPPSSSIPPVPPMPSVTTNPSVKRTGTLVHSKSKSSDALRDLPVRKVFLALPVPKEDVPSSVDPRRAALRRSRSATDLHPVGPRLRTSPRAMDIMFPLPDRNSAASGFSSSSSELGREAISLRRAKSPPRHTRMASMTSLSQSVSVRGKDYPFPGGRVSPAPRF